MDAKFLSGFTGNERVFPYVGQNFHGEVLEADTLPHPLDDQGTSIRIIYDRLFVPIVALDFRKEIIGVGNALNGSKAVVPPVMHHLASQSTEDQPAERIPIRLPAMTLLIISRSGMDDLAKKRIEFLPNVLLQRGDKPEINKVELPRFRGRDIAGTKGALRVPDPLVGLKSTLNLTR